MKVCKNGHTQTPENKTKDGRCKICRLARELKRRSSPGYKEKQREHEKKWSANNRDKRNATSRKCKAKIRAEGRRDYVSEYAQRAGVTREEYLERKELREKTVHARLLERKERQARSKELRDSLNDAHVKEYRASREYNQRLTNKRYSTETGRAYYLAKRNKACSLLTKSVIAERMKVPADMLTDEVIELKRSQILFKRELSKLRKVIGD